MPPDTRSADLPQQEHDRRNPAFVPSDGATLDELVTQTNVRDLEHREPGLRQDDEELRRIIDLIPQTIVVLNPDGKSIYANRVALEYTGLSLDELRADNFRDRVFHPEDVQRLREERQKGLSASVPFENEQRARGKDGKYRWFLIRYNPLIDERGNVVRWYATGTDIEYRKQAETKLRQEERELRQLIDFLPQHVLVLDKDGALLQANKTMLDYMGRTLDEMKAGGDQQRIKRDVHPDDLERARSERTAGLAKGLPFATEKRLLGKDGQFRWFLFRYNRCSMKTERLSGGSQRRPTSKTASRPKTACEMKPSRCESKSIVTRCSRTSSALRKHCAECFGKLPKWHLPIPQF